MTLQHTRRQERRYDLDWLRVFAFGLLIFYHIGMLYVQRWGFHYKSDYLSPQLESVMLLVNPWRMALLWMVSGFATAYLLQKLRWSQFAISRSVRLLLPLAFGVWIVVPPQLFVEMSGKGDFAGTYLEFYRAFLTPGTDVFRDYSSGIWPHVDVNHLWFLRELWQFTLLLLLLFPALRWLQSSPIISGLLVPFRPWTLLLVFPAFMLILESLGFPALGSDGDARRIALGLVFFLLGYLTVFQAPFWSALRDHRRVSLALALTTYALFVTAYHTVWLSGEEISAPLRAALACLDHANRWFWLCALFGFAYQYLNRPHPRLAYLTAGVYCFYLVHQTLILLAAYALKPLQLGALLEPLVIIVFTFGGCLLIYEFVRRLRWLRPLFGLKFFDSQLSKNEEPTWSQIVRVTLAILIVVPIGLEILI